MPEFYECKVFTGGDQEIYVDIDETICFYSDKRSYDLAEPHYGNIAKINKLYDDGYKIIYNTARGFKTKVDFYDFTHQQLLGWGCKFHELNTGTKGKRPKSTFYMYVDDKAIRIEELPEVLDYDKKMIIVRGLPGSGKTYLTNFLYKYKKNTVILNNDDIWTDRNGNYLYTNKEWFRIGNEISIVKCRNACQKNFENVVIDNPNTTWKEIEPYLALAKEYDYNVEVLEPNNEWSKDSDKCLNKTLHSIPKEVIDKHVKIWTSNEELIDLGKEIFDIDIIKSERF